MTTRSLGFTLVELGIVIAIIAVLAAVAIPRLVDASTSAEETPAKDMATQLRYAASAYTAEQSAVPAGFSDFVEETNPAIIPPKTISVATFGPNGTGCTVTPAQVVCTSSFDKLSRVEYNWVGNSVMADIQP